MLVPLQEPMRADELESLSIILSLLAACNAREAVQGRLWLSLGVQAPLEPGPPRQTPPFSGPTPAGAHEHCSPMPCIRAVLPHVADQSLGHFTSSKHGT